MKTVKLGWVGLGNMGNPMVMNLLKAGFEVCVFSRTKVMQMHKKKVWEIKM